MEFKCKKVIGLGERIRDRRETLKLSRSVLAKDLDVATSTLQAWELGDREPPASDIVELSKLLRVSTSYLLHGEETSEKSTALDLPKENVNLFADDSTEGIEDCRDIVITAGFGGENEEYHRFRSVQIERAWLESRRLKAEDCAMFSVNGDSMYPTLKDGEDIIVNRAKRELTDGKIFVLNHEGAMFVKRVQVLLNGVELISDNESYRTMKLSGAEADRLIVIGQVVRGYRDF